MKYFKNNQGQVLLIVMLVGMISLFITLGIVARVSRLTREVGEIEIHEAAFSTSEKYSRKILDLVREGGKTPSAIITEVLAGVTGVEIQTEGVVSLDGISLADSETYEVVTSQAGTVEFTISSFDTPVLVTRIDCNGVYSVSKRSFTTCGDSSGDLAASCFGNHITVYAESTTRSLRIRPIGGTLQIAVNSSAGFIADQYVIIATESEEGSEGGIQSETTLFVSRNKVMPTLFDYVLFNGAGQIVK